MNKTAVITGANRGLGLEFAKQLSSHGYKVFALCRKKSPELEALNVEIHENIDVTNQGALKKLVENLTLDSVDLLINNAGIISRDSLEEVDKQTILKVFEVNSVGPLLVTKAFLPKLKEGAKIAMITSLVGSIDDNSSGGYYGYRMSKAALNMASKSLSIELKGKGISLIILSPGSVRTDMTRQQGRLEPEVSIKGMLEQIEKHELKDTGAFVHYDGRKLSW